MKIFNKRAVILPALLTPFDAAGEVDYGALKALIDRLIAQGIDGIYANGSTAEVFLLSHAERMRNVEKIIEYAAGRVPVIAHVGSTSQREACELGKHAAMAGAAAISAVPPFYYSYTMAEIKEYYFALADSAQLPVLLYNIPIFTGVSLNADNASDLMADARIVGIKHTDFNLYQLWQLKNSFPDKLILNGHEECMIGALTMGADGGIGSMFNCLAPLACRLRDQFIAGDVQGAADSQTILNKFITDINAAGGFRAIKYIVGRQGINVGKCREPFAPISAQGMAALDSLMRTPEYLALKI